MPKRLHQHACLALAALITWQVAGAQQSVLLADRFIAGRPDAMRVVRIVGKFQSEALMAEHLRLTWGFERLTERQATDVGKSLTLRDVLVSVDLNANGD